MAVTLAQAAVLSDDDLQRGVLETFVQESSVLDRIPLLEIEGNAYAYNKEATLPGVAFRSVNEAYTESTGTFVQDFESLVILGGDADVDTFIVRTRGNLNDQRALQTRAKVKAASYKYQDALINGDVTVDPKGFDGLKKRLVGTQVLDAGANGIPIVGNGGSDTHAFLDQLDALLAQVPGITAANGVIYANASVVARLRSAGRHAGGVDVVTNDMTQKREITWQGIPFVDLGLRPDGTPILAQNESQGTAANASSIYAVKFGQDETEGGVTGLTNGGVSVRDLGEVQDKPVFRTRLEFFCGLATFGGQAAARLRGVLAA
jgi:hypothetical protein